MFSERQADITEGQVALRLEPRAFTLHLGTFPVLFMNFKTGPKSLSCLDEAGPVVFSLPVLIHRCAHHHL